jgi:hypothetical protein
MIKNLIDKDNKDYLIHFYNHKVSLDLIDDSCSIKKEIRRHFKLNIHDINDDKIIRYGILFDDTQFIKIEIYFDEIKTFKDYGNNGAWYNTCMSYLRYSKYGKDVK